VFKTKTVTSLPPAVLRYCPFALAVSAMQGSVLLPVDSAGRMLELLLTLEKMWATTEPK
jgi:hypothetical protein